MTAKKLLDRWPIALGALLIGLTVGLAGILIIGRTAPQTFWIVFGGNTDPGDGNGGGAARDQFVAGGWVDDGHIFQVTWKADISQDTAQETNDAMGPGRAAFQQHCGGGAVCIIAGFSLGNSPALQLSATVGQPANRTYLFGAPQPSTGVFHHYAPDNPFVNVWLQAMGGLNTQRPVAAGMQAFYGSGDPYANAAPQCTGPGLFTLNIPAHRIITTSEAGQHVWTGQDGVVMHEADYVAPPSFPRSGSDKSQPDDLCPLSGWYNQAGEIAPPVAGGTGPKAPGSPLATVPVAPPATVPGS